MLRVVVAAGRKRNFDQITFSGRHHMDLQSVEISALTAVISPIGVACGGFGVNSTPINPDVITDFDGAAIDKKNVFSTGDLEQPAEPLETLFEDRVQRVEPSVEAAPAKPTSEVRGTLK
jgi:hypothetical protein